MSRKTPANLPLTVPPDARVAVAAARFNGDIVEKLLSGCLERLKELGLDERRVEVRRVPGAFELPLAAKLLARTGRFSGVICLGAVVRGQTPHFDYVAGECARGVAEVGLSEGMPIIFGVLTTSNRRQALDRCGGKHGHAGRSAADAVAEMIVLARSIAVL